MFPWAQCLIRKSFLKQGCHGSSQLREIQRVWICRHPSVYTYLQKKCRVVRQIFSIVHSHYYTSSLLQCSGWVAKQSTRLAQQSGNSSSAFVVMMSWIFFLIIFCLKLCYFWSRRPVSLGKRMLVKCEFPSPPYILSICL